MSGAKKSSTHPRKCKNFVVGIVKANLKLLIMRLLAPSAIRNLNRMGEERFFVVENAMGFRVEKIRRRYAQFVELVFNKSITNKYIVVINAQTKLRPILCENILSPEKSHNLINNCENYYLSCDLV